MNQKKTSQGNPVWFLLVIILVLFVRKQYFSSSPEEPFSSTGTVKDSSSPQTAQNETTVFNAPEDKPDTPDTSESQALSPVTQSMEMPGHPLPPQEYQAQETNLTLLPTEEPEAGSGNTGLLSLALSKDYSYAHGFYYGFLDETEKKVYDHLIAAAECFATETTITPIGKDSFCNVHDAFRYDHPEYYWMNSGLSGQVNNDSMYTQIIINVPSDAESSLAAMNRFADKIASHTQSLSSYDAYRYIFRTIAEHTTYGKAEGVNDQTIDGVFFHRLAVCNGYANAFKFLCDHADLPCETVCGVVRDRDSNELGMHAFNLIEVDGSSYWCDPTWGDRRKEKSKLLYDDPAFFFYLFVDDKIFFKSHSVSPTLGSSRPGHFEATYPSCFDTRHTLYAALGQRFDSYSHAYDYVYASLSDGTPYLWMQFENESDLDLAVSELVDNKGVWEILREVGRRAEGSHYLLDRVNQTLIIEFRV